MKKILILLMAFLPVLLHSQYNPGALDFTYPTANFEKNVDYTGTDANGNGYLDYNEITLKSGAPSGPAYHLFDVLATTGKPVLIDFYTPSCGWCRTWTPIIDSLYGARGDKGTKELNFVGVCGYQDAYYPGFKGMYFFWESVVHNDFHPLVTEFPEYPQVSDVTGDAGVFEKLPYNITSHPKYVVVCPDRTWKFVEGWTAKAQGQSYRGGPETLSDSIMAIANGCDPLATETNDALIYGYLGPNGIMCNSKITPKIMIQSRGTAELNTVDILVSVNDQEVSKYHWSGTLKQYDIAKVRLKPITLDTGVNKITFKVENPNDTIDENSSNDQYVKYLRVSADPATVTVTFDFDYVSNNDFTWKILDYETKEVIFSKSFDKKYAYTVDKQKVCLDNNKCYDFVFISNAGYGINSSPDRESLVVKDESGKELVHLDENNAKGSGGVFTLTTKFCLGNPDKVQSTDDIEATVYPNPGNGDLRIFYDSNSPVKVKVIDVSGKTVFSKDFPNSGNIITLDLTHLHNGIYTIILSNDKSNKIFKYQKSR